MPTSDELILGALKREHDRLSRIAAKAKAEVDESMGAGSEYLAIYKELGKIIESKSHGPQALKRLGELKTRQARLDRIRKKDLVSLMDRQFEAECQRDQMAQEVSTLSFRISLYGRR